MSGDITQGLNRYSIETDTHFQGNDFTLNLRPEFHFDLFVVTKLCYFRFQSGDQSHMFEHVGM